MTPSAHTLMEVRRGASKLKTIQFQENERIVKKEYTCPFEDKQSVSSVAKVTPYIQDYQGRSIHLMVEIVVHPVQGRDPGIRLGIGTRA